MTPREGILVLDAERAVIEEANPFVTEILGYSREELLGRSFLDLCVPGDRTKGASLFETVRRDGYARCTGLPLRMRNGASVFAEIVGNSYRVDDRNVIQLDIRVISEKSGDDVARPPERADLDPLQVLRPS